ncbi:Cyclic-di-AMP phosphodiesterase GdpP [bioreactor metagenome]|uniref:Cyclic-di-AMP phosphodiesterase GdpP n=1 Tax=bioreactor metagenome TaxID=1076179 RepID=A0A644YN12_9ZZZZ|nr:DHH family phosphoesterase [Erysipelotrichaceae bacterium]
MSLSKFDKFKLYVFLIAMVELISIIFGAVLFGFNVVFLAIVIFVISIVMIILLLYAREKEKHDRIVEVSKILGSDAKEAFAYGDIGMLTYDENFVITWMSDFFISREINYIGEKVTKWLPDINRIFQGDEDSIVLEFQDAYYEIERKADSQMLFFKDITYEHQLELSYENEKVVVGLIHLDNYDEATQYQEEMNISIIDSEIKQPIIDWAKAKGMLIKRIKNDRFMVVLNETIFAKLVEARFSIMQEIQKTSDSYAIPITLSMAYARGTTDFQQLDEMLNNLLELAQSRGGDQVAIKKFGEDVKYFGGNREAQEKRSKVRVRVIAQTLRELIEQSHNVIIVGHKEMDFDCMGAAIGMSRIVSTYNKVVSIVYQDGDMEEKLAAALNKYSVQLQARLNFVNEIEALSILEESTLVIMVDHHNIQQTNAPELINRAKRIVVIDHHRRKTDFSFMPLLVYIESGASSVSELITELFPYQLSKVNVSEEEATIMFTGILIDTNRFKSRTGSRTFEAASQLKSLGADPVEADELLKDNYAEFELKTGVLKYCEKLDNGVIVTPYGGDTLLSRSIMSQIANEILSVQNIEAAFVIAMIDDDTVALSARSTGNINVQVIVEQMHGGGHFTAAALQRKDGTVEEIYSELKNVLANYFSERKNENESDTAS